MQFSISWQQLLTVLFAMSMATGIYAFAFAGSNDKTVCIWSLEDFALLNTINVSSAIYRMDISKDSTFLVLACDDQSLHVRSLTTGSEVHCLQGMSSNLTAVTFGYDNCRCVVGCGDGKCYVFDVHSASMITTLCGHSDAISSVQVKYNHYTFHTRPVIRFCDYIITLT